jgi:hypothetical protein
MFHARPDGSVVEMMLPMGAYALPKACEYCGAVDTIECSRDCRRPRLYFARKKPPFAVEQPVVVQPPPQQHTTTSTAPDPATSSPRNWVMRGLLWH